MRSSLQLHVTFAICVNPIFRPVFTPGSTTTRLLASLYSNDRRASAGASLVSMIASLVLSAALSRLLFVRNSQVIILLPVVGSQSLNCENRCFQLPYVG